MPDVVIFAWDHQPVIAVAAQQNGRPARAGDATGSSDDLAGLRLLRERAPGGMSAAAGEHGRSLPYFQRLLDSETVDCLPADVTRCGGISGFLCVAALRGAQSMDPSAHFAPQLTAHACNRERTMMLMSASTHRAVSGRNDPAEPPVLDDTREIDGAGLGRALRGETPGEVGFDAGWLAMYASEASKSRAAGSRLRALPGGGEG